MSRLIRNKIASSELAEQSEPIKADDSSDDEDENLIQVETIDQAHINMDPYEAENVVPAQGFAAVNSTYCSITKVNTFNKIRKRAQCKVCGDIGHVKSRCPLNPDKSTPKKPRSYKTNRESFKGATPTIVDIQPDAGDDAAMDDKDDEAVDFETKVAYEDGKDKNPDSEPAINKNWAEAHFKSELWDMRYQALVKYGEENGHCNVPYSYRVKLADDSVTCLGQWLQDQRKEKRQGNLKPNRQEKLQSLVDEGLMEWKPLKAEEKKWLVRFQAVVNYAGEHGHIDIPPEDVFLDDGSKADLSRWLARELTALRSNKLNPERDQLIHEHLVVPGFISEDDYNNRVNERKIAGESQWLSKYEALLTYGLTHGGDYNVPKDYIFIDENGKECALGAWLVGQRKEYKLQSLPRHREEKLSALMEHGFKWDASFKSEQWDRRYEAILKFYDQFKTCNVPHSYKYTDEDGSEVGLGRWLEHQRRCKKLKTLLPDRDRKLQQLVDEKKLYWDIYEADRRFRQWQENFNLLIAYCELNGTCEVPENAVIIAADKAGTTKRVQLGKWLAQQKIAKYTNKLEPERVTQLDRLVDEGKLNWDVGDLMVTMARTDDQLVQDSVITSHANAGWANDDDIMASDSEDEGINIQPQHTVVSSSSSQHKGLGLKSAAGKRGQAKAAAANDGEEGDEDSADYNGAKKKRKV